jgi:hypothetical protein
MPMISLYYPLLRQQTLFEDQPGPPIAEVAFGKGSEFHFPSGRPNLGIPILKNL